MEKHVIIIIKNNNDEYLKYDDERWCSFLFLNIKIISRILKNTMINEFKRQIVNRRVRKRIDG